MALSDTSSSVLDAYYQRMSEMTPAERIRIGVSLWTAAYSLQRAAVRRRNPEADEAQIAFEIAVSRFGPELARAAYRRG